MSGISGMVCVECVETPRAMHRSDAEGSLSLLFSASLRLFARRT